MVQTEELIKPIINTKSTFWAQLIIVVAEDDGEKKPSCIEFSASRCDASKRLHASAEAYLRLKFVN